MIMKCCYNIADIMLQFHIFKISLLYCIAIRNVTTLL